MKKCMLTVILCLYMVKGFSQDLSVNVRGNYDKKVDRETLTRSAALSDFIQGYPTNWITDYESVEIVTTSKGKTVKSLSTDDRLTSGQMNNLRMADMGTPIVVDVKYKSRNAVTGKPESRNLHTTLSLVPVMEASFIGGEKQMQSYFQKNIVDNISAKLRGTDPSARVIFTVTEEGKIANIKISKSSGDTKTDNLILDALKRMPLWKPAENSMGVKVSQEFVLNLGNNGC